MKYKVSYPGSASSLSITLNALSEMSELTSLSELFSGDVESYSEVEKEIIIDKALSIAEKHDVSFKVLGKHKIEDDAYGAVFDVENETLDAIGRSIMSGMQKVKESAGDFSKRLSLALKKHPADAISKRLSDLPVKVVPIEKKHEGYINRSFLAYARAKDITSVKGLLDSIVKDDITEQLNTLNETMDFLLTFRDTDKEPKTIKEELLKICKSTTIDKLTSSVISKESEFKVPKKIYGMKTEIDNGDVKFIATSTAQNNFYFVAVGVIERNFAQKALNKVDFSERFSITTTSNAFKITNFELDVNDAKAFTDEVEKELIYINKEIAKLQNLTMPVMRGMSFPDATYFDVYNMTHVVLFSRYALLMDLLKTIDIASNYKK
jgi:hypothetical protein